MPVGIGKQGRDGGHGGPFAVEGHCHVVDNALQFKMVADFLHGLTELTAVVGRCHAQARSGLVHDRRRLLKHAGSVQTEPVEGIAKTVRAVPYGIVGRAEGRKPVDNLGVAVDRELHVYSAGRARYSLTIMAEVTSALSLGPVAAGRTQAVRLASSNCRQAGQILRITSGSISVLWA